MRRADVTQFKYIQWVLMGSFFFYFFNLKGYHMSIEITTIIKVSFYDIWSFNLMLLSIM